MPAVGHGCAETSQPALSKALARLRKLFNDPLLIRARGLMVPTDRALELDADHADARYNRELLQKYLEDHPEQQQQPQPQNQGNGEQQQGDQVRHGRTSRPGP